MAVESHVRVLFTVSVSPIFHIDQLSNNCMEIVVVDDAGSGAMEMNGRIIREVWFKT